MTNKTPFLDDAIDLRGNASLEKNPEEKKEEAVREFFETSKINLPPKNSKWFRAGRFFLFLLFLLAPLFFLPVTIAPVETNKMFLVIVLAALSFLCFLADSMAEKRIIYPKSLTAVAVLALVFSAAISSVFSQAQSLSLFGGMIYPDSAVCFAAYGLIFFMSAVFFRKEDFGKIGIVFLSGAALAAIFGFAQIAGKFFLPFDFAKQQGFNTIGTYLDFGIFMVFALIMAIAAFSEIKLKWIYKTILAIFILIAAADLVLLNWRYLWLAAAGAMIVLLANKFTVSVREESLAAPSQGKSGGINLPLAALVFSLVMFIVGPSLPYRVNLPVYLSPDFSSTLDAVKNSLKGGRLIAGSGPGTFNYNFSITRPIELNQNDLWAVRFNYGYSFLVSFLATSGILGLLAILFLFFSFIRDFIRSLNSKEFLVVSLGAAYLLAGWIFYQPFLAQFVFVFAGLGIMSAFSLSTDKISFIGLKRSYAFIGFIAMVFMMVGGLVLLYFAGRKYAAAVYYKQGIDSGEIEKALASFDKAVFFDPESDLYLRALSQYLAEDALAQRAKLQASSPDSPDAINKRIQNDIVLAVEAGQRAVAVNPADSLNWSNLGNIYEKIIFSVSGADIFAEKNYQEAMKLDPKNPELPFAAARIFLASADELSQKGLGKDADSKERNEWKSKLSEASVYLEKSTELKANYAPAYYQKAMILFRLGETEKAIQKLEETKTMAPYDSGLAFELGAAYYNNNQIDKAQAELENALAINENYSNARYVLGLVYDKQGRKDKAISQFEKIASLNPNNEQIKKILVNLRNKKAALEGLAKAPENSNESSLDSPDLKPEPENTISDPKLPQ